MESLTDILPWFLHYGYVALFFIMAVGELYLPVPSNLALLAAGALSRLSEGGVHFNIFLAAGVAFIASIVGDMAAYYIARKFGSQKRQEKFETQHKSFRKISTYFKKHPIITICVTRLIGFLSPIVNSLAGFTKLSAKSFFCADVLGNAIYVILYMGIGYIIGGASGSIVTLLAEATGVLVVFSLVYIGAILLLKE
jgi:membrane protein DedA with SNARE-associated domain